MNLSLATLECAIQKLPKHYRSVVIYLFGDGEYRLNLVRDCLSKLNSMNATSVASMILYKSGDYETDSKYQEYIFDILKKGAVEKSILDSNFSLLEREVRTVFKSPQFLNKCIDVGFETPEKLTKLLLGMDKVNSDAVVPMRNHFVQAHVSNIILMLARDLAYPLSNENLQLAKALSRPFSMYEVKLVLMDLWSRYKYILALVVGYSVYALGGSQSGSLLPEPSIYLPFMSTQEAILSPAQQFIFKLELCAVFIVMFLLLIGHKFHYLIQPNRKDIVEAQGPLKKAVNIFYIYFLLTIASPFTAVILDYKNTPSPIEVAVEQKKWDEAEKLVDTQKQWSNEQRMFVKAQILIQQRYEMPKADYQEKLKELSAPIVKEFELGRFSDYYAQTYGVKKILDANNIENNLFSYDTHRAILLFWILCLSFIFISLWHEIDYLGLRKRRHQKKKKSEIEIDSSQKA
jgi:hypothetical protein